MPTSEYLFTSPDWFSVDRHQRKCLADEIDSIDGNRLLNTSVDDLCSYFVERYSVDVPLLIEDKIVADQQEVQIDVSRDQMRMIRDRSRPFYIAGTAIEVCVPFTGDPQVFKIQPSAYTSIPPRGQIRNNSLVLRVEGTGVLSAMFGVEIGLVIVRSL